MTGRGHYALIVDILAEYMLPHLIDIGAALDADRFAALIIRAHESTSERLRVSNYDLADPVYTLSGYI